MKKGMLGIAGVLAVGGCIVVAYLVTRTVTAGPFGRMDTEHFISHDKPAEAYLLTKDGRLFYILRDKPTEIFPPTPAPQPRPRTVFDDLTDQPPPSGVR